MSFDSIGYVHVTQAIDRSRCDDLTRMMFEMESAEKTHTDVMCGKSSSVYGAYDFLLSEMQPLVEKVSGKRLFPTYSYARLYKKGEVLHNHIDRESCEISVTLTLGMSGNPWPIFMGNADKSENNSIIMYPGDAVVYRGMDKYHWRDEFQDDWQVQVFLHYVDADGKYKDYKFDKRGNLESCSTLSKDIMIQQNDGMLHDFYTYTDILTPSACDMLVKVYSDPRVPTLPPFIGNGKDESVDHSVRNVQRVPLEVYKDLGARLAAVGLSCNHGRYKFDVTHAEQAEFLIYPTGGRYTAHVDTFFDRDRVCRKLTVLAFLNDDFEGGRFFFILGSQKVYPKQEKGTVLVFPSFTPHGVEDITRGTRYSAVCWMSGPWFK